MCVTKDNLNAPWLNFEAGALGKSVDKSRVCPFLFRIKRSEVSGPILQFQSTILEKEDLFKLLKSINDACDQDKIEESRLEKGFNVWWPSLVQELEEIPTSKIEKLGQVGPESPTEKMLEEILLLSRSNQMLLRTPEELLPASYIKNAVEKRDTAHGVNGLSHSSIVDLINEYHSLRNVIKKSLSYQNIDGAGDIVFQLDKLGEPIHYIEQRRRRWLSEQEKY
ncbi:hypothetical protein MED121_05388 [Marinomonas sp. MED121]|uniref:hypothetical protein n=1 Tax=Marinomonas sp. MED121 TaxID=314277 RepID=UPI000068FBD4|nr:hypothetical protein [Marinomonas sp. MED121]EAQ63794.1 hypothetical protein MED121_05388 [Marinomonas sp. MED121]